MDHGGGGLKARGLVEGFLRYFPSPYLRPLDDGAVLPLGEGSIAFTTDTHVVAPLFFPGGDIGRLAVCGTVNDLAVMGARPLFLSCALVLEEGLEEKVLERVLSSISRTAEEAGVEVVTGDTKVVERGTGFGMFVNTAGVGTVLRELGLGKVSPRDRILVSGPVGEHGMAVLAVREGLEFEGELRSDCAPVNGLVEALLKACPSVKFLRDPTRGGLAGTLWEVARGTSLGVKVWEERVPVREPVRGLCELLGIDPFYSANEGKVVAVVAGEEAEVALSALRAHPLGEKAEVVGEVVEEHPGQVMLETKVGGRRLLELPVGDPLPRIC
ncbi:MAG TPA: hydrogenase expression/formation protein HypE [Candidatus Latescibacteria bacterium]|nr:hydrogenase expression/formation protein HypE [Candidatus Latescibacterota bacterium]